jgi:hypothetical protein
MTAPRRVDANGTMLRIRALHVLGHGSARIARALGVRERVVQRITNGTLQTVGPGLHRAVGDLFDQWWDLRAPERTHQERSAATAARRRAAKGNWCAGAGLDDDLLDDPGYIPTCGYRPARGTGIAPDFSLQDRRRSA